MGKSGKSSHKVHILNVFHAPPFGEGEAFLPDRKNQKSLPNPQGRNAAESIITMQLCSVSSSFTRKAPLMLGSIMTGIEAISGLTDLFSTSKKSQSGRGISRQYSPKHKPRKMQTPQRPLQMNCSRPIKKICKTFVTVSRSC